MENRLTPWQLGQLRSMDTATICNAIETFGVRHHTEGYMGNDVRCMTPELGPMLGYAVTAVLDSTSRDPRPNANGAQAFYRILAEAPKPAVVVIQDGGEQRTHSCLAGDVMATLFQRLGAAGLITNGNVRDLAGIRELDQFHVFAAGIVPSHGLLTWIGADVPVTLSRLTVHPGDLIHADANGVVLIPHGIAGRLAEATRPIIAREEKIKEFANSPEFTIDGLMKFLKS